jgi:hypothetical protein
MEELILLYHLISFGSPSLDSGGLTFFDAYIDLKNVVSRS